jgi:hypothetical protein
MKTSYTILCLLLSTIIFSQENGKWDSFSIQEKRITLDAGQSHNLSITLPKGTTKVFYTVRAMKLVGEKEELSIISRELSKSPTPNLALLATQSANIAIGMNDAKISYSIKSQSDNNTYNCYNSQGIVTNERVYIDYTDKNCLDISGSNLKLNFNFKSENKFFGLRLVFEIIPFVDNELKRGWSQNIKNYLYENFVKLVKENNNELKIENIENFAGCLLSRVMEAYTFTEFKLLAEYERKQYVDNIALLCKN